MGKVIKIVAVVVAVAVVIFAPQISAAILAALTIKSAVALALLTAAITVGAGMALKSLGMGAPSTKAQVGPPAVFRQSITESFIVYGKRRVGGLLVFFHPKKVGKRHYRYFVIASAGHRCQGVVSWMLNDEVVTVDGSNKVTSGPYANAAWLWFQRGLASETANATFVSECGGKWTSAHKGNDVAAIYAKFELTDAVVEAGMPNITAVIEGRDEVLDTRDATEKYTENGALIFYDWLATPREEGGFGAYVDEIPDDAYVSAQANVCDETVNSEARYALSGVIVTGAPPGEIRDVLVVNMAGSYTYSGGKHLMRVGYWVPVSETLSEDDLAGAIQVSPFLPSDSAANEVQGSYISPDDNYQGAPFTTQTTDPAPSDIRQMDLDLAFTTNKDQADRIARIMLNRAQAEKTVAWPANITGLKVKALDMVQFDTARYSLSNYAFVIVGWGLSPEWNVVLTGREENEDIYTAPTPVAPVTPPALDLAEPLNPFDFAPLMPDLVPLSVKSDHTGTVLPGQLTRNVAAQRLAGDADVTTDASWSMAVLSGDVTASIGASTGIVSITALGSDAVIEVTSSLNDVDLSRRLKITKDISEPPVASGTGSTSAYDGTITSTTSASYGSANAGPLTITAGASGDVDLAAPLTVTTAPVSPDGSYPVYGKWRWRPSSGGAWTDAGTEITSTLDVLVTESLGGGDYFADEGVLTVNQSVTGLTPATDYEFELLLRNDGHTREMFYAGTASATTE